MMEVAVLVSLAMLNVSHAMVQEIIDALLVTRFR